VKQDGESAARGDEEEADRINAAPQPDWEELGSIRAQIAELNRSGRMTSALASEIRTRATEAIPADRPELLAEIASLIP
jgi:hypothetical protein